MSVTLTSKYDAESYACEHCDADHRPQEAVESYCSWDCLYEAKGARQLQNITTDHRWCATCWRRVKTVNKPPTTRYTKAPAHPGEERWRLKDLVIGYQYPTEHMTVAANAVGGSDGDRLLGPPELAYTRWSCTCGTVDTNHRDPDIEAIEAPGIVDRVHHCLQSFHDEGQYDQEPDRGELAAALAERPGEWAYAIGRALYSE